MSTHGVLIVAARLDEQVKASLCVSDTVTHTSEVLFSRANKEEAEGVMRPS